MESSRTSLASWTSSRTHFQVLGLEAAISRKLPCPRLKDSTIFESLKFRWKTPETLRKICKDLFFWFPQVEMAWKKIFEDLCSDSTFCRFHKLHHCFSITAHQSNLPILFITVTLLSSWRNNDIQWRLVYKAGASRHLLPYSDSQRNKIRMQCWLRINERWKLIRLFDVLLKYIEPHNWWPRRDWMVGAQDDISRPLPTTAFRKGEVCRSSCFIQWRCGKLAWK